jgi:monoamine oxidase
MDKQLSGGKALRWDSPIRVVGASLAGPAAAAFLRAAGFDNVKVLESGAGVPRRMPLIPFGHRNRPERSGDRRAWPIGHMSSGATGVRRSQPMDEHDRRRDQRCKPTSNRVAHRVRPVRCENRDSVRSGAGVRGGRK